MQTVNLLISLTEKINVYYISSSQTKSKQTETHHEKTDLNPSYSHWISITITLLKMLLDAPDLEVRIKYIFELIL